MIQSFLNLSNVIRSYRIDRIKCSLTSHLNYCFSNTLVAMVVFLQGLTSIAALVELDDAWKEAIVSEENLIKNHEITNGELTNQYGEALNAKKELFIKTLDPGDLSVEEQDRLNELLEIKSEIVATLRVLLAVNEQKMEYAQNNLSLLRQDSNGEAKSLNTISLNRLTETELEAELANWKSLEELKDRERGFNRLLSNSESSSGKMKLVDGRNADQDISMFSETNTFTDQELIESLDSAKDFRKEKEIVPAPEEMNKAVKKKKIFVSEETKKEEKIKEISKKERKRISRRERKKAARKARKEAKEKERKRRREVLLQKEKREQIQEVKVQDKNLVPEKEIIESNFQEAPVEVAIFKEPKAKPEKVIENSKPKIDVEVPVDKVTSDISMEESNEPFLIDDFNDVDPKNGLGNRANIYERQPSSASIQFDQANVNGVTSGVLKLSFSKMNEGGPYGNGGWGGYYSVIKNDQEKKFFDASDYKYITLWARGENGTENFVLGLADERWDSLGDSVKSKQIGEYYVDGKLPNVTTEWQKFKVPLSAFPVIKSNLASLSICFESFCFPDGLGKGIVYIDDISFEK